MLRRWTMYPDWPAQSTVVTGRLARCVKHYTLYLQHRLICSVAITFAVLQDSLHGALPVRVPADPGRAGALAVLRPPALPQVHLMEVVHQEQSCKRRRRRRRDRHMMPLSHQHSRELHGSRFSFAFTWLRCIVQVLLKEGQRAHQVRSSGWVVRLVGHKLSRCAAELEKPWGEVEFPRI